MEFKIAQKDLKNGLAWVQNVVEKKTTKPILTNVLLECENNQLNVHATDLEVGVQVKIPAQVKTPNQLAVPAKSLYDMVREIGSEEIEFKKKNEQWLQITAGKSKFKLAGLPADEFPTMPTVPEKDFLTLDAPVFKGMIEKTLFAVSIDSTKPTINGILLQSGKDKNLLLAATDGHRLSYIGKTMTQDLSLAQEVIIPRKGMIEIQKMLQEEDGILPFLVEGRNIIVKQDNVILFVRLIEGKFPDYQKIIPQTLGTKVKINREALIASLRRVSLFSQDHNRGVKFTFSPGYLELLCSNPDLGEAREEIECDYSGEAMSIGFNYRYFLDVLGVLSDENIMLELRDPSSPCLIKSELESGFASLVMPMRI